MSNPFALVIEDDPKQAFIFAEALRMADFEAEMIQDGKTALERLAATNPVLVILDLHLPQLSGLDVLAYIRADKRLARTQVIVATADANRAERLRGEADFVLLKPISFRELIGLVQQLRPPDSRLNE